MAYSDYILLSFLWSAYCVVHSALISVKVTEFFKRTLGDRYRFYRLFFNLFSVGTLVPLLFYSHSPGWNRAPLFVWEGNMRIAQYGFIGLALFLAFSVLRHYSMMKFLGIHQIRRRGSKNAMTETGELDSSGVLGVVRHPWYLAVLILLWASDLDVSGIIINVILTVYLVIGTNLEEQKLLLEFGDQYKIYQGQVSMFIPVKWLKSRISFFVGTAKKKAALLWE